MRKSLLTAALAAMAMTSANAQVYDNIPDYEFDCISDNGQFISASNINAGVTIINRYTGQQYDFSDPAMATVYSCWGISNNGIAVGNNGYCACYWKDGKEIELPQPAEGDATHDTMGTAFSVSANGKYIIGGVTTGTGYSADNLMMEPVIWTLQADGTYTYEVLPYDKTDFSGRAPQYISAQCITEDGKSVVVQVRDYSGAVMYPIFYTKQDDGTWTRKTFGAGFFWDEEKIAALPEMPVNPSKEIPNAIAYFTKQDTIDYNKAVDNYRAALDQCQQGILDWSELPVYPQYWMYISEKRDQWVADSTAYMAKANKYNDDLIDYLDKFQAALYNKSIVMNQWSMSTNGKYVATAMEDNNLRYTYPAYFDLTGEEPQLKLIESITDGLASSVSNNGTLIANAPAMEYTRNASVINVTEKDAQPVPFYDYIAARDAKAGEFLKTNYSFNVPVSDGSDEPGDGGDWGDGGIDDGGFDEGGVFSAKKNIRPMDYIIVPDSIVTGTVSINSDATIFLSFMREEFSNADGISVDRSYVIDLNKDATSGIHTVKVDNTANGTVIAREYYGINGQRLGRLPLKGVYLEKIITTNGVKTVKRVK